MQVIAIAITVAARCAAVDEKYPGGMKAFEEDAPNGTFRSDGELAAVSFVTPPGDYVHGVLVPKGLVWLEDFVVVDQHNGPTTECDWIHFGKQGETSMCWIGAADPIGREIVGYKGWTPAKRASMNFIPQEALDSGAVTFEKVEPGIDKT